MNYTAFSLGGNWEMDYSKSKYNSTDVPNFSGYDVKNAVPGY